MPLQIRRGTDAERAAMTQPLASGELLYVTDEQKIYVGNGTTLGGIVVSGYNDEDAQDAAASLFTTGTHSGISFTYNDTTGTINAVVDLSPFDGPVVADSLKGSVFADDSSLMVDAIDKVFYGNLTGDLTGNVYGSVYSNTSTLLVDYENSRIVGDLWCKLGDDLNLNSKNIYGTGNIEIDGSITLNSETYSPSRIFTVDSAFSTSDQVLAVGFRRARGTLASPAATQTGDQIMKINLIATDSVGAYIGAGAIRSAVSGTPGSGTVPINIEFLTGSNTRSPSVSLTIKDNGGIVAAGFVQFGSYTSAQRDALTAANGMVIYNTDNNKFEGFQAGSWVNLVDGGTPAT